MEEDWSEGARTVAEPFLTSAPTDRAPVAELSVSGRSSADRGAARWQQIECLPSSYLPANLVLATSDSTTRNMERDSKHNSASSP